MNEVAAKNEIVVYQPNKTMRLEVMLRQDTVWLNRQQLAQLFGRDVKTIGKHIANALQEELSPVVADFATTESDKEDSSVAKSATVQLCTDNPSRESEIVRMDKCGLESGTGQNESDKLYSVCWICKQKQSDPGYEKVVKMSGDGRDESFLEPYVCWKTLDVLIPRCQVCAEREQLQSDDLRFRLKALAERADKLMG